MPERDGSGPLGMGPMTGRGAGFCAGVNALGLADGTAGTGGGRGRRNCLYATGLPGWLRFGDSQTTVPGDREFLQRQAEVLQSRLNAVKRRLNRTASGN